MNLKTTWAGILFLLGWGFALCAHATQEATSAQSIPWPLVAHSDLIVVGKLVRYETDVPKQDGFVEIDISKVLKGSHANGTLHTEYGVSDDLLPFLKRSQGKTVIAFLMGGEDPYSHHEAYQLYEPDGLDVLIPDSAGSEKLIQSEIVREQYQAKTIPILMGSQESEAKDRVDEAVDKLSSYFRFRRDQGIDELLKIGCKGVPYIAMHLNDNRPVHGMMRLFEGDGDWIWTPEQFEKLHLTVGDTLPRILFEITSVTWQLRGYGGRDAAPKQKQYEFWLTYVANHIYKEDPEDFGAWHDRCAGLIWK